MEGEGACAAIVAVVRAAYSAFRLLASNGFVCSRLCWNNVVVKGSLCSGLGRCRGLSGSAYRWLLLACQGPCYPRILLEVVGVRIKASAALFSA